MIESLNLFFNELLINTDINNVINLLIVSILVLVTSVCFSIQYGSSDLIDFFKATSFIASTIFAIMALAEGNHFLTVIIITLGSFIVSIVGYIFIPIFIYESWRFLKYIFKKIYKLFKLVPFFRYLKKGDDNFYH